MTIRPFDEFSQNSSIVSIPKADIHIHQEETARLERVLARRRGRSPHNWRKSARRLIRDIPPGESRLEGMYRPDLKFDLEIKSDDGPEYIIAKIMDALAVCRRDKYFYNMNSPTGQNEQLIATKQA